MNTVVTKSGRAASIRRPVQRRRRAAKTHPLEQLLGDNPRSARYGVGVVVGILECDGGDGILHVGQLTCFSRRPARPLRTPAVHPAMPAAVARVLAGLAHPDRVRIAQAMLRGADSHLALAKMVGLKAGPLYHHLKELERAGLISREHRNHYGLTQAGRILVHLTPLVSKAGDTKVRHWRTYPRRGSQHRK